MYVTKCDVCGKQIEERESSFTINQEGRGYSQHHVCAACGKPIHAFLKKHGLGEKEIQI